MSGGNREASREALLDAGLQQWSDGGWSSVDTIAAAAAAGVPVEEFADEFPDGTALACEIFDAIVDERSAAVISVLADAPPSGAVRMRAVLEAMFRDVERDHRRAVVLAEPIGSAALLARRRSANRGFAEMVVAANRESRIEPDQLRTAGHFVIGGLCELVFAWLDPGSPMTRETAVEHGMIVFEACVRAR